MSNVDLNKNQRVTPEMTVLDVVDRYRGTEAVFRKYDKKAGACICCQALFDTLKGVSEKYGLDLNRLITELEAKIDIIPTDL
jgi:hypothetical protein